MKFNRGFLFLNLLSSFFLSSELRASTVASLNTNFGWTVSDCSTYLSEDIFWRNIEEDVILVLGAALAIRTGHFIIQYWKDSDLVILTPEEAARLRAEVAEAEEINNHGELSDVTSEGEDVSQQTEEDQSALEEEAERLRLKEAFREKRLTRFCRENKALEQLTEFYEECYKLEEKIEQEIVNNSKALFQLKKMVTFADRESNLERLAGYQYISETENFLKRLKNSFEQVTKEISIIDEILIRIRTIKWEIHSVVNVVNDRLSDATVTIVAARKLQTKLKKISDDFQQAIVNRDAFVTEGKNIFDAHEKKRQARLEAVEREEEEVKAAEARQDLKKKKSLVNLPSFLDREQSKLTEKATKVRSSLGGEQQEAARVARVRQGTERRYEKIHAIVSLAEGEFAQTCELLRIAEKNMCQADLVIKFRKAYTGKTREDEETFLDHLGETLVAVRVEMAKASDLFVQTRKDADLMADARESEDVDKAYDVLNKDKERIETNIEKIRCDLESVKKIEALLEEAKSAADMLNHSNVINTETRQAAVNQLDEAIEALGNY